MRRGKQLVIKPQNKVSIEPSLFVFPPIQSNQRQFIIKNVASRSKGTQLQSAIKSRIPHNYSIPSTTPMIIKKPQSIHQAIQIADPHELEQSIGGTSLYQFSELDQQDQIMAQIEAVISNKGDIFAVLKEIEVSDLVELKSLYPKLVSPLLKGLNKLDNGSKQYSKGFGLLINILEDSLHQEQQNIAIPAQLGSSADFNELISHFLLRFGMQISYIRQEAIAKLEQTIFSLLNWVVRQQEMSEAQVERILRGSNLIFRSAQIRTIITAILDISEAGECGKLLQASLARFLGRTYQYKSKQVMHAPYLQHLQKLSNKPTQ